MNNVWRDIMLPLEIYHLIAAHSEAAYRAMLAVPLFARDIDVSKRYDYMIFFGYSVDIGGGRIRWTKCGATHRADGPAVEWIGVGYMWWVNDQLHRLDGPAIEYDNGYREWRVRGQLHRIDGPAVVNIGGACAWWVNGRKVG